MHSQDYRDIYYPIPSWKLISCTVVCHNDIQTIKMFIQCIVPAITGSKDLNKTPPDKKVATITRVHWSHPICIAHKKATGT